MTLRLHGSYVAITSTGLREVPTASPSLSPYGAQRLPLYAPSWGLPPPHLRFISVVCDGIGAPRGGTNIFYLRYYGWRIMVPRSSISPSSAGAVGGRALYPPPLCGSPSPRPSPRPPPSWGLPPPHPRHKPVTINQARDNQPSP